MELTLSTPAILFPAMTVLMLAYTNRFIAISNRVRALKEDYAQEPKQELYQQIRSLRRRLGLIRNMQVLAVGGFLGCVICMVLILAGIAGAAFWVFGGSLFLLGATLVVAVMEIFQSVHALDVHLMDLGHDAEEKNRG